MKRECKDNPTGLQRRAFALELRGDVADDGTFEGYGSVFGVVDWYGDIVAKGAFKASLREWKAKKRLPPMLWQHDSYKPIGPWLDMQEDDHGLFVRGQLLREDVQQAREAHALLKTKAIGGLSIGFVTRDDSYDEKTGVRTIKRADLWEVSLVTFPANEAAQVTAVKSALDAGKLPTIREFEAFLREQGFSRSQAEAVAEHGLKHLLRGSGAGDEGEFFQPAIAAELRSILTKEPV